MWRRKFLEKVESPLHTGFPGRPVHPMEQQSGRFLRCGVQILAAAIFPPGSRYTHQSNMFSFHYLQIIICLSAFLLGKLAGWDRLPAMPLALQPFQKTLKVIFIDYICDCYIFFGWDCFK